MANEITGSATLNVSKGGVSESLSGNVVASMAGVNIKKWTQTIATSATAIDFGSITGIPPNLLIKNLDTANFVQVDSVNTFSNFPQKILNGCVVLLAPQTATIYLKANIASVQVEMMACEP